MTTASPARTAEEDGWVAPGKAVVHVKTWGCGHNNSDGEYMSGLLSEYVASTVPPCIDVAILQDAGAI